jgi:hypothetical protein
MGGIELRTDEQGIKNAEGGESVGLYFLITPSGSNSKNRVSNNEE